MTEGVVVRFLSAPRPSEVDVPNTRIQDRFAQVAADGRGALLPYFTSGFPVPEVTEALIRRADELGVAAVEIGVPYSDSIADGPVIQESFHDVLQRGYRLSDTFELVARVRSAVECGLIAMLSYSIVHRVGTDAFFARAAAAGFDGVIIPDVPLEEATGVSKAAQDAGLCFIGLVAPTTSPQRRARIAQTSSGFIYQIAVSGTTGERSEGSDSVKDAVDELRRISRLPVCVGFGVSSAAQVRAVCGFADGAIVGSAIVRRLADAKRGGATPTEMVESVSGFLAELTRAASGRGDTAQDPA